MGEIYLNLSPHWLVKNNYMSSIYQLPTILMQQYVINVIFVRPKHSKKRSLLRRYIAELDIF